MPENWRDDLRPMLSVTEKELQEAVQLIPPHIRARLAQGPRPHRWTCGVCEAFGKEYYKMAAPDPEDPMWIVFSYHEVPKIEMMTADDQWYGKLANDVYERCIATYRAAGWTGIAEEANA